MGPFAASAGRVRREGRDFSPGPFAGESRKQTRHPSSTHPWRRSRRQIPRSEVGHLDNNGPPTDSAATAIRKSSLCRSYALFSA
jgi:hypothetical protein